MRKGTTMKRICLTVYCQASYTTSIEVPNDVEKEEDAVQYAKDHMDQLPLGLLEYISDSDEIDEGSAESVYFIYDE